MTELLILDDQPYTTRPFADEARKRSIAVTERKTIGEFVNRARSLARSQTPFAALIDMNLRGVSDHDIDELGATSDEIGNGEAAGMVVLRHIFAGGEDEAVHGFLSRVPIALISAEALKIEAREELLALQTWRPGHTAFIPKAQNAIAIPDGQTYSAFLDQAIAPQTSQSEGEMSPEQAIFLDVRDLLQLSKEESARLLGFTGTDVDFETVFRNGTQPPSRDWSDRLGHLMDIFVMLARVYSRRDFLKWLNAPQARTEGRSPRDLLIGGKMNELLAVESMVMEIANQG